MSGGSKAMDIDPMAQDFFTVGSALHLNFQD